MKGLLITRHIGAQDIVDQLGRLGHHVDVISWSAHNRYRDWPTPKVDMYDPAQLLNPEYCKKYSERLLTDNYDFFVSFYEPISIMLFEALKKPLLAVLPIRAWYPYENRVKSTVEALTRVSERLQLIANNRWDQNYARHYIIAATGKLNGLEVSYIPSICDSPIKWTGREKLWILDYRNVDLPGTIPPPRNYTPESYMQWRGFIDATPRQVSTMSFFERYNAGMPMIYPTPRLLRTMYEDHIALQELHFVQPATYDLGCYDAPFELADFYIYPHIQYYDSPGELCDMIATMTDADCQVISERMLLHGAKIAAQTLEQWREVMRIVSG